MTLIIFVIVLAIFLIWNWLIITKRSPNHAAQVVYRSLAWLIASAICSGGDKAIFFAYFIGFHLAFWFPFDLFLNLMRGRDWNYIGQTAWLDKMGARWPGAFLPLKFLLFLMGLGFLKWPLGY